MSFWEFFKLDFPDNWEQWLVLLLPFAVGSAVFVISLWLLP